MEWISCVYGLCIEFCAMIRLLFIAKFETVIFKWAKEKLSYMSLLHMLTSN